MMAISRKKIIAAYTTPGHPAAFSSPGALYKHFKGAASLQQIKRALTHSDGYTLHRETRRPKHFNPYYILHRRQQIQGDLVDISALSEFNSGTRFLLVMIDGFSRKVWVYTLKNKTAISTSRAMRQWLNSLRKKPRIFFSDAGLEFNNRLVKQLLHDHDVELQFAKGNGKAGIVERVNKTLQVIIYKYLSEYETGKYYDVLPLLIESYNKRKHRSLKNMTPNEADKLKNEERVRGIQMQRFSKMALKRRKAKLILGDLVRVQTKPGKLGSSTRAYAEQAHGEYYQIVRVSRRMPIPMYYIKSLDSGMHITEGFYEYELTKVAGDVFKMRVIDEKGRGRNKKYLVRWLFFGPQHDMWIKASEITADFRQVE